MAKSLYFDIAIKLESNLQRKRYLSIFTTSHTSEDNTTRVDDSNKGMDMVFPPFLP